MRAAVTVLGSSAMYATVERACSGYLLEVGGCRIWLDAGAGSWRNLLQYLDYDSIGGIILTHRHPDHVTDVFQAFHARQYGAAEPLDPIPVWAPQETLERITGYYRELDKGFDLEPVADGDVRDIAGARVSFVRMAHPPETLGVRVEHAGGVIAYSADTGPNADFKRLAGGADVFLCEATLQESDGEWDGHLTAAQAGAAAADAEVGKLVLTHLPAVRDLGLTIAQAEKTSGGIDLRLAADGLRLEI